MLIVDAHQDLAWNILTFGRDYLLSAAETRQHEQGSQAPLHNGDTLLGWPDYQRGRVAVVFATLFAAPIRHRSGPWDTQYYATPAEANIVYRAQMDAYHCLTEAHPQQFRLVLALANLEAILAHWQDASIEEHPVGLVILMENAEGVRDPVELEDWWELGVRIIGPAWAGNSFCGGTREPGPLTPAGYALLDGMADLGFSLDISHMDTQAALQALDHYPGSVIASHANVGALLNGEPSNRHLTDQVIRSLVARDGTIGIVPYNRFLIPGWSKGDSRQAGTIQHVIAHIDHICQMAGDSRHVGFGSDFDGGFGVQSVPAEIDTIADLQKLAPLLAAKGYTEQDIAAILGGNWLRHLQNALPEIS